MELAPKKSMDFRSINNSTLPYLGTRELVLSTDKTVNKRTIVALNCSPVPCASVIKAYMTPGEANFGPRGII